MAVKKKEHENLTPANIRRVAALLDDEKPISKKDACELLNISYNTKRLERIIEEQQAKDEAQKRRRQEKRGKPVSESEKLDIATMFLDGDTLADIAERVARPSVVVKRTLEAIGVPEIPKGEDKLKPGFLPDQCVREGYKFEEGETAWSAIHHCPVEVDKCMDGKYVDRYGAFCYRVWVKRPVEHRPDRTYYAMSDSGGFTAYVAGYELGDLQHLTKLGVKI